MINLQNFYKDTLKRDFTTTGIGKFYLTLAKPTVVPGIVVISPNNASLREIIKYTATGTDSIGDYVEVTDVAHRGLGGTTAQTHKATEPVRMNITQQHFESILVSPTISDPTFTGNVTVPTPTAPSDAVTKAFAEGLANAGASDASTTGKGISRISTAPGTTLGTATITIATPGVVSLTAHGLTLNDIVKFTTTGALPTGLTANTPYYVIASGLTANAFQLSASQGGSAINTSGTQSGVHTLIEITPVSVSDTDPRIPTQNENDALGGTGTPSTSNPYVNKSTLDSIIGQVIGWGSRFAPTGYLSCNGGAVSRSTYPTLFSTLNPLIGTATMTIASPGVITKVAHGLVAGDKVYFTTTGALPTGIVANTVYFVISTGITADAFQISANLNGTAINTSGTQSGTHSLFLTEHGIGDGSTTFNVPNYVARTLIGAGTTTKVATFVSRSSNVLTVSGLSDSSDNEFQSGQPVLYSTSGSVITGLTNNTTYYLIRVSNTTFSLATSLANANANTAIALSSDGTGVQTFTVAFTTRKVGDSGGEEKHLINITEMPSHSHNLQFWVGGAGGNTYAGSTRSDASMTINPATSSAGGDTQSNNMSPYAGVLWVIKAL